MNAIFPYLYFTRVYLQILHLIQIKIRPNSHLIAFLTPSVVLTYNLTFAVLCYHDIQLVKYPIPWQSTAVFPNEGLKPVTGQLFIWTHKNGHDCNKKGTVFKLLFMNITLLGFSFCYVFTRPKHNVDVYVPKSFLVRLGCINQ